MNVLVTGGTGFLGQAVVRRLLAAGERVRVLVRPSRATRFPVMGGAEPALGDLREPLSLMQALDGMEAVCHCAAHMTVGDAWSTFEAVTVQGTEMLLQAAAHHQVKRFLHVSSLGVYGDGQATVTEESPFDASPDARGPYTRSKIESERLVWAYAREHGLPITVIRPGPLYGPGRPPFVARICVPVGSKFQMVIARSDQYLPLTYVENVAEAICLALEREQAIGRDYNIVDGEALQQGAYLGLLRQVGLSQRRTIVLPPAPLYPMVTLVEQACRWMGVTPPLSRHQLERTLASVRYDTSRAQQELGWSPKVGLVEALRTMQAARGESTSA
jgi:nucleoside-diphosphate-sugar epimerase